MIVGIFKGSTWLVGLLAMVAAFVAHTSIAEGAIYWANGSTIGRANLDGSHADPNFISQHFLLNIRGVCGLAVNESHIYWADEGQGTIGRANLDGTNPEYAFITGASRPCGVAVDDSHVYWANREPWELVGKANGSIGRAGLDGTEQNQEFLAGIPNPCGVAVDDQFLYWTGRLGTGYVGRALLAGPTQGPPLVDGIENYDLCGLAVNEQFLFWGGFGDKVGRVGIDGSNPEVGFISGIERPCGVALDDGHIYWSENSILGALGMARLDGSEVKRGIITDRVSICGIAVDGRYVPPLPPPYVPPPRPGACALIAIRHDPSKGSAVVVLDANAHGRLSVKTRGLGWRVLTDEPEHGGFARWRVKIWPGATGPVAKRIRRQLGRKGRAPVNLRISCDPWDERILPSTKVRKIALRRVRGRAN
ncbi:MAG: hypothetical protein WA687_10640 [Solirubrobacterales bacterium]